MLFVDRATLSIKVGGVFIRIENLDFIETHQKDAAVASSLTAAGDLLGGRPFDVQLTIAKLRFRLDCPRPCDEVPILNFPVVGSLPLGQVGAAKEHRGIGWGTSRRTRIDDLGLGPLDSTQILSRCQVRGEPDQNTHCQ